jgi:glycosyltransferase involved in cell wall biosynthesis
LVEAGHAVDVYTTSVDGNRRSAVAEGVPVDLDGVKVWYFRSRFDRLYWSPAMGGRLRQAIRDFDVVHLHSVFLWPTTRAARVARKAGVPYVLSPRGMLVPELMAAKSALVKRAWIRLFERQNLRHAARIHVTSFREAEDLRRCELDLAPVVELPNGVEVRGVADRNVVPGQVLFLGRLSWKKNLPALLDAISRIPEASLVLAGPDDEGLADDLRQRATNAGCAERFRVVGAVGSDRKRELFATSVCAVLPSLNENFGNVVLEALAASCPVVVSPGVGAREIVEASGGGLVAAGSDAESLRASIAELLSDPISAEQRGAAGARYVRAHLGWPAIAERMASVYREICDEVSV